VSSYNSSRELALKMDSEGGLAEMMYGYGLEISDLPADMRPDIKEKLLNLMSMDHDYAAVQGYLYDQMENDPVPGDYDYPHEGSRM
jgi:hypothetical protein